MIEPAEEIYILFEKETGDIKTGGGSSTKPSVHAYTTEGKALAGAKRVKSCYYGVEDTAIAKYILVEVKECRE